ncbi:MAG TPA: hypothetical protein VI316_09845 [Candidatus Dormibacteraeota bacterium]
MALYANLRPRFFLRQRGIGKGMLGMLAGAGALLSISVAGSAASPLVPSPTSCTGNSGEPEIFYVDGVLPSGGATPQCATILPASGVILPGDTIGAIYSDESHLNTNPSFPIEFDVDGVAQPFTVTDIVPPQALDFQSSITITVPGNLAPGLHTAKVHAWDSDQTRAGGDLGEVIFTFGVSDSAIKITPTSATNQVGQQHVFTVTVTATPFAANLPVVFGAITTSVTPTPNKTNTTTCTTPAISGDVATCTITINSSVAGTFTANAGVALTINGQALTRSTNGSSGPAGSGGSGPAIKTYVAALPPAPTPTPPPSGGVGAITTAPTTGALGDNTLMESLVLLTAGGTLVGWVVRRRRRAG